MSIQTFGINVLYLNEYYTEILKLKAPHHENVKAGKKLPIICTLTQKLHAVVYTTPSFCNYNLCMHSTIVAYNLY
jgi:hypothetical protein